MSFFYIFFITNSAAQSSNIIGHHNKIVDVVSHNTPTKIESSVKELMGIIENNRLKKLNGSTSVPDSIMVNLGNGIVEKHYYTYNANGLIAEEQIRTLINSLPQKLTRTTNTYNDVGKKILAVTEISSTFGWENTVKYISEYDLMGNRSLQLVQNWENNNWINFRRLIDEYNLDGKSTVSVNETWDGTQWVPSARYTNEYDQDANMTSSIIKFESGGVLENWRMSTYTYDSAGNNLTWSDLWWEDGAWFELSRYIYEYDSENRIISTNYLSASGSDSLQAKFITIYDYPQKSIKTSVTYDYVEGELVPTDRSTTNLNANGDRVYILREEFSVDILDWVNSFQSNFTYNGDGILTDYLYEVWEDSAWINAQKYTNEFDSKGNNTYQSFKLWDNGEWVAISSSIIITISDELEFWFFALEVFVYYSVPASSIDENNIVSTEFKLEQNYPNPFNPRTMIEYSLPKTSDVKLTVYNVNGREIRGLVQGQKDAGNHSAVWNALDENGNAVSSGVYFYQIEIIPKDTKTQSFFEVKKMILMK